jgi:hypothetical protein
MCVCYKERRQGDGKEKERHQGERTNQKSKIGRKRGGLMRGKGRGRRR